MDNLSFHITDITANSIRAKASDIEIDIQIKDTSIFVSRIMAVVWIRKQSL